MASTASSTTQNAPEITIVIPAYNAERFLADTLDSVLAQTLTHWQCIIVDDGSTDQTLAIAQQYAQQDARFEVITQANAGCAAARNHGAKIAKRTPFIIFLDNDDLWLPETLQLLRDFLQAHPQAPAVHGHGSYINQDGQPIKHGKMETGCRARHLYNGKKITNVDANHPTTFQTLATLCSIWTPGLALVRTEAFHQVQGFRPQFIFTSDWDFWVRLSRIGDIPFLDQPVIQYRQYSGNASSNKIGMIYGIVLIRNEIMGCVDNTPQQQQFAKRAYRAFYLLMAKERLKNPIVGCVGLFNKKRRRQCLLGWINLAMALTGKTGSLLFILLTQKAMQRR